MATLNVKLLMQKYLITLVLILSVMAVGKAQRFDKPNVIIILADDMGYGDLGCYGNKKAKTPHIDKLAKEGIRFLDFHSNGAVCSPTRAALLTGKYPQSVGISGVITAKSHRHVGLDIKEILIPEVLKKQDYKTGIIGKWHLGYDTAYSPVKQGFDIFQGYTSGNVDYISHFDQENNFDWWLNTNKSEEKGYTTDLITEHSISFIEKNKNDPFFLYVAHEAPHAPYQVRESEPERREGKPVRPVSVDNQGEVYSKMIEIMDEGIGKMMATLEKLDIAKKTLVIFISDNGANQVGSNLPYKGFKGQVWEGGHRIPAIVSWKGAIKPATSTELLMTMDIFPTICELTGAVMPRDPDFAGKSFKNVLFDKKFRMEERPLFWNSGNSNAIRKGKWKLVNEKGKYSLFDISTDPGETINVYEKFPFEARSLREVLENWVGEMSLISKKS